MTPLKSMRSRADARRSDELQALDERLRAKGIDPSLPWLPLTAQLDLLIPACIHVTHGEDRAPAPGSAVKR